jgi:pSer/pThr/pTyr-binding forkhead associated (FHA) protein
MYVINLEWTIEGTSSNRTAGLNDPATVGRLSSNTIQIAHPSISREHASLRADSSGVKIKNLSENAVVSINGTQNIAFNHEGALADGNFVTLGTVKVGVRIVVVPDGTTLDAHCVNCGKPISSQEDICPWCKTSQSSIDSHMTGVT